MANIAGHTFLHYLFSVFPHKVCFLCSFLHCFRGSRWWTLMRTTFVACFILCPVTLQGKNCECSRFGFASRLGRDYQTLFTTERHAMQIEPRRLPQATYSTGHKALPHHTKPKPLPARFLLPVPKHQGCFSSGKPGARHPREQAVWIFQCSLEIQWHNSHDDKAHQENWVSVVQK